VIRDDRAALVRALEQALASSDLALLSGGSSVGAKDMVSEIILSFPQSKMIFHGISVSPGKPTIFAEAAGKPVMGLPGYPVSALVIFERFGAPLIRKLGGEAVEVSEGIEKSIRAVLKTNVASQQGREDYIRVSLEKIEGRFYATPLPSKSGAIFTLVKADGMIRVNFNQEGIEQGEEVEVLLF
jgi:molybdopterin molybdotransferase